MNFTTEQREAFKEMCENMVKSGNKRIAELKTQLKMTENSLRGSNHVMQINTDIGIYWMAIETDETGLVIDCDMVSSPALATHLSPRDAKRLEAKKAITNDMGNHAVAVFDRKAYQDAIEILEKMVDEYENQTIEAYWGFAAA